MCLDTGCSGTPCEGELFLFDVLAEVRISVVCVSLTHAVGSKAERRTAILYIPTHVYTRTHAHKTHKNTRTHTHTNTHTHTHTIHTHKIAYVAKDIEISSSVRDCCTHPKIGM